MATLVKGVDYYYVDAQGFTELAALLNGTSFNLDEDFPWFRVTQDGYAGYYFPIDEISDDEWDILVQCSNFNTIAVFESVQANYLGIE